MHCKLFPMSDYFRDYKRWIWLHTLSHMGCVVRKPSFCICENKYADQLHSNCAADQRLCFRYMDSTIPLLPKSENFKLLAIFRGCTSRFVSGQVRIQNVGFSPIEAYIIQIIGIKDKFTYFKTKLCGYINNNIIYK